MKITPEQLQTLKNALPTLDPDGKKRVLELLKQYETDVVQTLGKESLLTFADHVYPGYKIGPHHRRLAKLFEEIAAGKRKRVIVNIAPRHGKSELISYLAPAWFLGKFPHKKIIMSSHTADLAVNFGRRVRNLVGSDAYKDIFPQVELQADSKSASRWGTNFQGEYFAIGVGGALAGRGADLFIIDDPHSEQEAKTGRPDVFLPAWEWFQSGPIQRLMPGGAIIVVMCMTGDTPVRMADGTEKPLRDIRPGDRVATYEDGQITTSRVNNWQSSGVDQVFTVQTRSGKILRANERHPFLVEVNGERQWVRLKNLQPGMSFVATKAAPVPHALRKSPDFAIPAKPKRLTTGKTQTPRTTLQGTMGSGKALLAQLMAAIAPSKSLGFASPTTTSIAGKLGIAATTTPLSTGGPSESSLATESLRNSTTQWLRSAATSVMSVVSRLLARTPALTGAGSYASTTVTTLGGSVDCCATTATLPWDTEKLLTSLSAQRLTCDVTLDEIVSIIPSGREEVFDIEVERTGNFIANGVVSHNTRWSKLDLTGQIINQMIKEEGVDEWEVVEFPAILNDKPLWPEFWSIEELLSKKAGMDPRYWQAQYMQNPVSEEGALIKREWWQIWDKNSPPQCEFMIMSLDAAQEANTRADYNALTTWGVFFNEETNNYNIILLNSIKQRMEFPDLKKLVLEQYEEWQPDAFIVEKKSNGAALYQELRRMGVPVGEFTPGKGQDKIARVNAVSDLFRSGFVWAPDRRWAKEVIEECNDFPSGTNDDLVDSTTQALMRFRQGGFIRLPSDMPEEERYFRPRRRAAYY